MDKKEFKVGDRVRLTTNIELDDCFLQNGETAYVEEVEDDLIIIKMEARKRFCVENFEIELVADADPKTAFLNDLSELLRKYDAKIGLSYGEHEKYGWCEYPTLTIDNRTLTYAGCDDGELTADNVLNYDK